MFLYVLLPAFIPPDAFGKHLAEKAVASLQQELGLPLAIVRPALVASVAAEPYIGYAGAQCKHASLLLAGCWLLAVWKGCFCSTARSCVTLLACWQPYAYAGVLKEGGSGHTSGGRLFVS